MTLYVDSSALIKRYVDEPESETVDELLAAATALVTARHTVVEVRRNLARLTPARALGAAQREFRRDLEAFSIVELDEGTCELAATIAETTGARSLDALHIAAAKRVGGAITFLSFDVRQGQAARTVGLDTAGV